MTTDSAKPATPARKPAAAAETTPMNEILSAFVRYRRAAISATLGPPGINRGGAAAITAQARLHVLAELEALSDWIGAGMPPPTAVLSEEDREFWNAAKRRGVDVPQEILEQL